jgi:molecular chaperone HscB
MNYFEVFELPQKLAIDATALEKQFHRLSRQHHPDYFAAAAPEERSRALRMTALLNDAYRTLRQPTRRVEYLVSLYGFKPDGSKVPQSLLMEVFEINEQLEELRAAGKDDRSQLDDIQRQVRQKRERFDSELDEAAARWDRLIDAGASQCERREQLSKLVEILSEAAYIRNLEDEIEGRQGHYFKGSH